MNRKVLGVSVLEIQLMQEVGGCQGRKDSGMGKGWKGRVMRYRGDLQSQPQTWQMCGKGKRRLNLA